MARDGVGVGLGFKSRVWDVAFPLEGIQGLSRGTCMDTLCVYIYRYKHIHVNDLGFFSGHVGIFKVYVHANT